MKRHNAISLAVTLVLFWAGQARATPQSDLVKAAQTGNVALAKKALKAGADPKVADDLAMTPLHYAMLGRTSSLAVATVLVEAGADLNARDFNGGTPLNSAWSLSIVKYLVSKGADINAADKNGVTPLGHLVEQGKDGAAGADFLIKSGAKLDNPAYLLEAAMRLQLSTVELLLSKGVDPNVQDELGQSPLHRVAMQDQDTPTAGKVIDLLIKKGADLKLKDKKGFTPYSYAFWDGSFSGHLNRTALKNFLERGVDISEVQAPGYSPVMSIQVIRKDDVEFLRYLAAKGFDLKAAGRGTLTGTVLHVAAYFFLPKVAAHMIDLGADVNARGFEDMTPLHSAMDSCENNADTRIAALLLAKGTNIEARRSDGRTALHMVANYGNAPWTKFLLGFKPDVNARTHKRQTPLVIASILGNMAVVDLLIANGADVLAVDAFGNSPYYYAQQFKHVAIMESLKKAGAPEQTVDGAMKDAEDEQ